MTHLCKSLKDLESLARLNLTGCPKLWKVSWSKKYVNQLERLKALCIGGEIQEQSLLSLPRSLMSLDLTNCKLDYKNDVDVVFRAQSLFDLYLWGNPFEYLPTCIDLKMLRKLSLYSCQNLKSLLCIPSTIEELNIDWCKSLERITFQSARFSLKAFEYKCCFKLSEIQGLFKLVSISTLDEGDLGDMKWIKAYQYHKVDLIGDRITKGRIWQVQVISLNLSQMHA